MLLQASSLLKLADTKADNVSLLHFLAEKVGEKDATYIDSLREMRDLLKKVFFACACTFRFEIACSHIAHALVGPASTRQFGAKHQFAR